MRCGVCGRGASAYSSSSGWCGKDNWYLCPRCATYRFKCPNCNNRAWNGGPPLLIWMGGFLGVAFLLVLLLVLPQVLTNIYLDGLPTTPLEDLQAGNFQKVYAQVGPGQGWVIEAGYISGSNGINQWVFNATPEFNLTDGNTTIIVNTSELSDVRDGPVSVPSKPGSSEWVVYHSGNWMAVAGNVGRQGNDTVIYAQYIATSAAQMGHSNGDDGPFWALSSVGGLAVMAIGLIVASRRSRRALQTLAKFPPPEIVFPPTPVSVKDWLPVPNTQIGKVRRAIRRWLAAGLPMLTVGLVVYNLEVFVGSILVGIGGTICLVTALNWQRARSSPLSLAFGDEGLFMSFGKSPHPQCDEFIPLSSIKSFLTLPTNFVLLETDNGEQRIGPIDLASSGALAFYFEEKGIPKEEVTHSDPTPVRATREIPSTAPKDAKKWEEHLRTEQQIASAKGLMIAGGAMGLLFAIIGLELIILQGGVTLVGGLMTIGLTVSIVVGLLSARRVRLLSASPAK